MKKERKKKQVKGKEMTLKMSKLMNETFFGFREWIYSV